jgi:glycosyltransferase involved in cell wall biosynthesis
MAPEIDVTRALDDAGILHIQKAKGIGGSEIHIVDLCTGLRRLGARPEILWLAQKGHPLDALMDLCTARGLPAQQVPIRGHMDPHLSGRLRRSIRRAEPALLHLHLVHATLYGALAARGAGPRQIVATRHGNEPYQRLPWFRLAARLADRVCCRVIVPSEWTSAYTARWDGTSREKLRVIPHGIDLERFSASGAQCSGARAALRRSWGARNDDVVIACVARLHPAKDHDTLLRAFAALHERVPGIHLVLVGSGPREAELRRRAGEQGPARIHFLGQRSDVERILAASDIAALATRREGFCLSALEAMAAGLPLVATRIGPLPELVGDGQEGFLTRPGDATALATALERLARNPRLRDAMGRAAYRAAQGYTQDRMVNATARLYAEVLQIEGSG